MSKINILLVDDKRANLLALESMLQNPDYNLVKAESGAEALRYLLHQDFALVLLDVQMPGLNGFEIAALIRARERTTYTPIIFVTATSTEESNISSGYSLGAVDYIFKPVLPDILRAKVQVFAELFKKTEQIRTQADALARTETELRKELADHKASEEALRQSEEKFRVMFSEVTDAIVVYDTESERIIEANDAAVRLYGYARKELLGLTAGELFAEPAQEGPAPAEARALGMPPRRQRRKDGSAFPAEITRTSFRLRERQTTISLIRDVTERRKTEEIERLRAREQLQREFIATVSHELRTPIAAIRGFAETLRRGAIDDAENRGRFIRIIEKHAERLGFLVEDLLAVAALESGKMKPHAESIGLPEFVSSCVESVASLASKKAVSIKTKIEPAEVRADYTHLSRVMQNLLDNAIKYNRKGGRINVEAHRAGNEARITVSDTGIGIPAADLPSLFQQFHRTSGAKATAVRGTGLGLYIVKNIVESNGGRIWVDSVKDKGSAFHFTVPLAAASR